MKNDIRRIVVIGGSGVTGQAIAQRLGAHRPDVEIVAASRSQGLRIDLTGDDAAAQLRGFDLAILAVGPFDKLGVRPHLACLEAGIDCVDVSDAPALVPEILALDGQARARGIRIATGMGMCPGLTSWMLRRAVQRLASRASGQWTIALFLGGDQAVGPAAIQTMLGGFGPHVLAWEDRRAVERRARDQAPSSLLFPGFDRPVPVFELPLAEAFTLSRGDAPWPRAVDLRAHFEGLTRSTVRLLRSPMGAWPSVQATLRWLTARLQPTLRKRGSLHAESLVWIFDRDAPERAVVARGLGSYAITAAFATQVSTLLLDRAVAIMPGVITAEDLDPWSDLLAVGLEREGLRLLGLDCGSNEEVHPWV